MKLGAHLKLGGNRVIKVGSVPLALDPSDKCRRWLTRECDLLSQNWALTRSKAKHLVPAPQAQAGSQSTHIFPPVSNQTGLSLLSFTSQQKQSGEEFLLRSTNLPTRWEGGQAHTNLCYYYILFSTTHSSASIYSSYSPSFHSGELQVRGLTPTSSRLSRSSSVLLHKGTSPPPDLYFETINTASRLLSQFTSPSASTVTLSFQLSFSVQHSAFSQQVSPASLVEDHIGHRHSGEVPFRLYTLRQPN